MGFTQQHSWCEETHEQIPQGQCTQGRDHEHSSKGMMNPSDKNERFLSYKNHSRKQEWINLQQDKTDTSQSSQVIQRRPHQCKGRGKDAVAIRCF